MEIVAIHRYPVKSLAGEALAAAALTPGRGLANDRRYAFVPAAPGAPAPASGWRPKSRCVALVRCASAARLAARYDDAGGILVLGAGAREIARGRPEDAADRARLDAAASAVLAAEVGSGVALAAAGADAMLTDNDAPYVSLVNLASLRALAAAMSTPLDPLRFRANFYFDGAAAWAERAWPGREIVLGAARLAVVDVIERCAATEVNPATAARDAQVLRGLADRFGHVEMGVYARVIAGGTLAPGGSLSMG
jgi:uncharacterized protein YcbX